MLVWASIWPVSYVIFNKRIQENCRKTHIFFTLWEKPEIERKSCGFFVWKWWQTSHEFQLKYPTDVTLLISGWWRNGISNFFAKNRKETEIYTERKKNDSELAANFRVLYYIQILRFIVISSDYEAYPFRHAFGKIPGTIWISYEIINKLHCKVLEI